MSILREGIETRKAAVAVDNRNAVKSKRIARIRSAASDKEHSFVQPNKRRFTVKAKRKVASTVRNDNGYFCKENREHSEKRIASNIPVAPTGGRIKTAVGGTRNSAGRIQTAVNMPGKGVLSDKLTETQKLSPIKCSVKHSAGRLMKGNDRSVTKTDNSTVSDSGVEGAKYVENNCKRAEKAVKSAVRGSIRTAEEISETPKEVKHDVRKIREKMIRKNREKQIYKRRKKSRVPILQGRNSISISDNVVEKKGKLYLLIAVLFLLMCSFCIIGFAPLLLSVVSGMFSWTNKGGRSSQSDSESSSPQIDHRENFRQKVKNAEKAIVDDIDSEVGYEPEYRYDGTEIAELKQYENIVLNVDENAVIAAVAVVQFTQGSDDVSEEKIAEMIRNFFEIEVTTTTDYCPGEDCSRDYDTLDYCDGEVDIDDEEYSDEHELTFSGSCYEHTSSVYVDIEIETEDGDLTDYGYADVYGSEWEFTMTISNDDYEKIDWENICVETETIYCDNPDHTMYNAEVTYPEINDLLEKLGITGDKKTLYDTYYEYMKNGGL